LVRFKIDGDSVKTVFLPVEKRQLSEPTFQMWPQVSLWAFCLNDPLGSSPVTAVPVISSEHRVLLLKFRCPQTFQKIPRPIAARSAPPGTCCGPLC
jgi:hypothetical protein